MADVTDTKIRAQVQQVLAKHWIDMEKTNFMCARGVVRMLGEIQRARDTHTSLDATKLYNIERELEGLRGVRNIHYEFKNWRRSESGGWRPVQSQNDRGRAGSAQEQDEERSSEL